jgi:superfamily II DNA or RNA helicase
MRIQGALGGILVDKSSSSLIKDGYLVKPTIMMFHLDTEPKCSGWHDCYTKDIIENDQKNSLIKGFAEEARANGLPTVILVERIKHGEILEELIDDAVFVPGKERGEDDPTNKEKDHRKRMLNELADNNIILIATQWIYTGVDCPPMQCLILAGSASSSITTYQQLGRVLRLSPDTEKHYAIVIDFYHKQKYLKKHSNKRKKTYAKEEEYDVKVIKPPKQKK